MCLNKDVFARATHDGTHVADITHTHSSQHRMVPNSLAHTPPHKRRWNCSYTPTLTPKLTAPTACTTLQTTFSYHSNRKTMAPENVETRGRGVRTKGEGERKGDTVPTVRRQWEKVFLVRECGRCPCTHQGAAALALSSSIPPTPAPATAAQDEGGPRTMREGRTG